MSTATVEDTVDESVSVQSQADAVNPGKDDDESLAFFTKLAEG